MADEEIQIKQEDDARNALLEHFSSKSSNQTIILLTLALVFFGWVQSLQYIADVQIDAVKSFYYIIPMWLMFAVGLRAVGRLFYIGDLTDSAIRVEPEKGRAPCLRRLSEACIKDQKKQRETKRWMNFRFILTHGKWFNAILFIAFIILAMSYLPWKNSILSQLLNPISRAFGW